MAYTIYNNNGTILVNLASGEVDDVTTSLDLVGKNVNNYGEILNNNFVKLLTNFSNSTSPRSPQVGQLWYNPSDGILKIWKGDSFKPVYDSAAQESPPLNPSNGDYWFDKTNSQLKVYTPEKGWNVVGPNMPVPWGRFGVEPPYTTSTILVASITDNANNNRATTGQGSYASVLYSWGRPSAILSRESFQLSSSTYQYYTTSSNNLISTASDILVEGVNVIRNLKVFNNTYMEGNLYLKGDLLLTPNKNLTTYYNITRFGDFRLDPLDYKAYLDANAALQYELKRLYPVETTSTFQTYGYPLGSEVRVLCEYTTSSVAGAVVNNSSTYSIRRFRLNQNVSGVKNWEPLELYRFAYFTTTTNTNIVVVPNPPYLRNVNWVGTNTGLLRTSISSSTSVLSTTTAVNFTWSLTPDPEPGSTVAFRDVYYFHPNGSVISYAQSLSTSSYILNFSTSTQGRYTATIVATAESGAISSETRVISVYNDPIIVSASWAGPTISPNTFAQFSGTTRFATEIQILAHNSAGQLVYTATNYGTHFSTANTTTTASISFSLTGVSSAWLRAINPVGVVVSASYSITVV